MLKSTLLATHLAILRRLVYFVFKRLTITGVFMPLILLYVQISFKLA